MNETMIRLLIASYYAITSVIIAIALVAASIQIGSIMSKYLKIEKKEGIGYFIQALVAVVIFSLTLQIK